MASDTGEHPALQLFRELLAVHSPSGQEEALAQIIRTKLESWGYAPQTDHAGNVTVRLEGKQAGPLVALDAHMDEISLIVVRVEEDGALRVDRSGGLLPHKFGEGPVDILGDVQTVTGIVSMGSGHMATDHAITWPEARVLTGLSAEQLKAAGVRAGSSVLPVRERRGPYILGGGDDPVVAAWTFDDRMGCVSLLRLLETLKRESLTPVCPLLVVFAVREEIGGEGAKIVALREKPEIYLTLDGCMMVPGSPFRLDGRPGVWTKDRLTQYDPRLVRDIIRAGREAGVEVLPVAYDISYTDASAAFSVGGTQRIACIGHPRENSHGYEVARLSVFENIYRTVLQFVTTWDGA